MRHLRMRHLLQTVRRRAPGDPWALGRLLAAHGDPPPWADPRPDLVGDHAGWRRLLEAAYLLDGDQPYGVFGALQGCRRCGARLEETAGAGWRLAPGAIAPGAWQALRRRWLRPHAAVLAQLLAELEEGEA